MKRQSDLFSYFSGTPNNRRTFSQIANDDSFTSESILPPPQRAKTDLAPKKEDICPNIFSRSAEAGQGINNTYKPKKPTKTNNRRIESSDEEEYKEPPNEYTNKPPNPNPNYSHNNRENPIPKTRPLVPNRQSTAPRHSSTFNTGAPKRIKDNQMNRHLVEHSEEVKDASMNFAFQGNRDMGEEESWELPKFMRERLDKERRPPAHPSYDSKTLYVPKEEIKKMSPAVQQYWEIKSQNMDKIVLFKLGKFYEIFNEDAMICHKSLGLKWTAKFHVGFPEKVLDKYMNKLIEFGYRMCVVEQMETPRQMKERLEKERKRGLAPRKTIHREICQVMSKGIYNEYEYDASESNIIGESAKYTMIIFAPNPNSMSYGVLFFDVSTLNIYIKEYINDTHHSEFKTLLAQVRPVEVVYKEGYITQQQITMLKNMNIHPMFSPISKNVDIGYLPGVTAVDDYFGDKENGGWPDELREAEINGWDEVFGAFAIADQFLSEALISDKVYYIYIYI